MADKKLQSENTFPSLKELLEAGAHFGHSVKRRNPRMDEYVYATKNGVQIFDLVKTRQLLEETCQYLEDVTAKGGKVLVLGTKGQAAQVVRETAEAIGTPYIVNRWVGGLFTNWDELKKRIERLIDMKKKFEEGEYKKYTKKEQVLKKREIDRLERMYGGLVSLTKLPDVLFVIDPSREDVAVREAIAVKVPIAAIVDTNCDPTQIEKVIPANDDALKTVDIIVRTIMAAIERGIKRAAKNTQAEAK
ncbi:MAG: 30S ribosomal protein S2 [Microgenomates group bacterium GW2011_GWF2_47_9]|nr:MAG: 30S ribosomal protein S2 [Microgenomates group bacterium GW2011_GWF2_47_9]